MKDPTDPVENCYHIAEFIQRKIYKDISTLQHFHAPHLSIPIKIEWVETWAVGSTHMEMQEGKRPYQHCASYKEERWTWESSLKHEPYKVPRI